MWWLNPAQPGARVEEGGVWERCQSRLSCLGEQTELTWESRSMTEEKVKDERRALRVLGEVRGSTWQGGRRAELQGLTAVGESWAVVALAALWGGEAGAWRRRQEPREHRSELAVKAPRGGPGAAWREGREDWSSRQISGGLALAGAAVAEGCQRSPALAELALCSRPLSH